MATDVGGRRGWRRRVRPPGAGRFVPALVAAASVVVVLLAGALVPALLDGSATGPSAVPSPSSPTTPGVPTASAATSGPGPTAIGPAAATTAPPDGSPAPRTSPAAGPTRATLTDTFAWRADAPLLPPRSGPNGPIAFKDPDVVRFGGAWHVFVTTADSAGFGLAYLRLTSLSDAATAEVHDLGRSGIGAGFRSTPQVFWFAPQRLWYMVFQTGEASYSTNPDIGDPNGWSAPEPFYGAMPELVRQTVSGGGYWLGMWVVCDDASCWLFSSDNKGRLFRSRTSVADFPRGMSDPVVAAQSSGEGTTFAAGRVYRLRGDGRYLLLAQAFGPDGRGYLRSWTAASPDAAWRPLADTPDRPFARATGITFSGEAWAQNVLHGDLVRDGYDQRLVVDPCGLRLLVSGFADPYTDNGSFRTGLLTASGPTCR